LNRKDCFIIEMNYIKRKVNKKVGSGKFIL
jgi:hypothetical protein